MDTKKITTQPVESSNIKAVGFDLPTNDGQKGILQVDFKNGSSYQYEPVSWDTYQELIHAPSIGKYFNGMIRTNKAIKYTCIKKPNK